MLPSFLFVAMFGVVAVADSSLALATPRQLTSSDQKNHLVLLKKMLPEQRAAIAKVYPDFRILKLCPGSFSGAKRNELVLGLWKPLESSEPGKREVHRVGLLWSGSAWVVHNIDDEIQKDESVSRSFPLNWEYAFTDKGFTGAMKCGVNLGKEPQLHPGRSQKPLFNLRSMGLQKNKAVCFATSDVYNNWDCLVFSPKDKRFRLWYQQAYAD
jgi:hypothetical protein